VADQVAHQDINDVIVNFDHYYCDCYTDR
jgi:hypothetical protein